MCSRFQWYIVDSGTLWTVVHCGQWYIRDSVTFGTVLHSGQWYMGLPISKSDNGSDHSEEKELGAGTLHDGDCHYHYCWKYPIRFKTKF